MTTPIWLSGFESGVLSTNGGGLCNAITGSPAIASAVKRTGNYSLRCNAAGAATYIDISVAGSPTILVARFYIRCDTLPGATGNLLLAEVGAGKTPTIAIRVDDKFNAGYTGGTYEAGPTVATDGTWYRVDCRVNVSANPHTIDWAINGVAQTQSTYAQAATTITSFRFGTATSVTMDAYFDDAIVSATTGDYPIGLGQIDALLPSADGTHNNAANTIEDNAGNDIDGATHYAYDHINNVPISESTLYLKQVAAEATKYVEVAFANPGSYTAYHGVRAILAYMSSGTNANEGACIVIDEDATATTVWGSAAARADYSESSMFYKSAVLPAPAGGLDQAAISAITARLGYSNDIADVPYWENLMLEVAHNATAPAAGGVPKHMMYYKRLRGSV